jgi:hypothetical protein
MNSLNDPMHQRKNNNGHKSNSNNMYARGGRDVEGGGYGNDTNSNILEQQNNDRISELSEQVARLKVNIENENKNKHVSTTRSISQVYSYRTVQV